MIPQLTLFFFFLSHTPVPILAADGTLAAEDGLAGSPTPALEGGRPMGVLWPLAMLVSL